MDSYSFGGWLLAARRIFRLSRKCDMNRTTIPMIDVAIPIVTAHAIHCGSSGWGQATAPKKATLTDEIR